MSINMIASRSQDRHCLGCKKTLLAKRGKRRQKGGGHVELESKGGLA
jgi:hypothetical protein